MKKNEVKVGGTYTAKVTDKLVPVRIEKENPRGGWDATNLVTNRAVRIKSAQRLRGPASAAGPKGAGKRPAKKKLTAAERKALVAQHKADQENARVRDERAKAPDGMTASERAMAASAKDGKKKAAARALAQEAIAGPKTDGTAKRLSLIDAAAQVLAKAKRPMNAKEMVAHVAAQELWEPARGGKTPHATLYSAILREIKTKGKGARFEKVGRGQFQLSK